MPASTLHDLIHYLKKQQLHGRPRPVLLLGAGASKGAGLAAMEELFVRLKLDPKDPEVRDKFCDQISRKTALARYELLEDHLQTMDPGVVTPGYRALADLCASRVFDLVLTANFDPLLDDALASANLKRRHYVVLINGVIRPERMNLLLSQPDPRLKIIKLHGDLFYRQMAWTLAEMDDYLEGIWPQLTAAVAGRDFLTVGYSLKDPRIANMVLNSGGRVWITNYSEHPTHLSDAERERLDEVVSTECSFESLFTKLAQELGVVPAPVSAAAQESAEPIRAAPRRKKSQKAETLTEKTEIVAPPRSRKTAKQPSATEPKSIVVQTATTVDDLLAAVVGVWNPQYGLIGMTGFVLAEPRVIVVDGCMNDPKIIGFKVNEIVTSRGVHLPTKAIRHVPDDRFGPLLLEVPPELEVPGLRLNDAPVPAGLPIQIGVAVQHESAFPEKLKHRKREHVQFGLSNGLVKSGLEFPLNLSGYHCGHVVELACAVAPGSSGAPVVDEQMAVRGFIVGGSADLKEPRSFMFPAFRWGSTLKG